MFFHSFFKWFETETVSTLCIAAPNKFTCLYKQTGGTYGLKREQRYHCISTSISFSHFCFILIPVIFRSSMPFTIVLMDAFVYVCMHVCVSFFHLFSRHPNQNWLPFHMHKLKCATNNIAQHIVKDILLFLKKRINNLSISGVSLRCLW